MSGKPGSAREKPCSLARPSGQCNNLRALCSGALCLYHGDYALTSRRYPFSLSLPLQTVPAANPSAGRPLSTATTAVNSFIIVVAVVVVIQISSARRAFSVYVARNLLDDCIQSYIRLLENKGHLGDTQTQHNTRPDSRPAQLIIIPAGAGEQHNEQSEPRQDCH